MHLPLSESAFRGEAGSKIREAAPTLSLGSATGGGIELKSGEGAGAEDAAGTGLERLEARRAAAMLLQQKLRRFAFQSSEPRSRERLESATSTTNSGAPGEYSPSSRHWPPKEGPLTLAPDGVIETANAKGDPFGFERTREISSKSATEIAEATRAWRQNDDITVVDVRRRAKGPTLRATQGRVPPPAPRLRANRHPTPSWVRDQGRRS